MDPLGADRTLGNVTLSIQPQQGGLGLRYMLGEARSGVPRHPETCAC
jgi:hypothetical protein